MLKILPQCDNIRGGLWERIRSLEEPLWLRLVPLLERPQRPSSSLLQCEFMVKIHLSGRQVLTDTKSTVALILNFPVSLVWEITFVIYRYPVFNIPEWAKTVHLGLFPLPWNIRIGCESMSQSVFVSKWICQKNVSTQHIHSFYIQFRQQYNKCHKNYKIKQSITFY